MIYLAKCNHFDFIYVANYLFTFVTGVVLAMESITVKDKVELYIVFAAPCRSLLDNAVGMFCCYVYNILGFL